MLILERAGEGQAKDMEYNACFHLADHLERRNTGIFESKEESVISIKERCSSLLFYWCKMEIANDVEVIIDFLSSLHNL